MISHKNRLFVSLHPLFLKVTFVRVLIGCVFTHLHLESTFTNELAHESLVLIESASSKGSCEHACVDPEGGGDRGFEPPPPEKITKI